MMSEVKNILKKKKLFIPLMLHLFFGSVKKASNYSGRGRYNSKKRNVESTTSKIMSCFKDFILFISMAYFISSGNKSIAHVIAITLAYIIISFILTAIWGDGMNAFFTSSFSKIMNFLFVGSSEKEREGKYRLGRSNMGFEHNKKDKSSKGVEEEDDDEEEDEE